MFGNTLVEHLDQDRKLQLALVQLIEIVGEAASRIPHDFRQVHPRVPWQLAADMRHKLIHGYDVIEYSVVYDTVTDDLPALVRQLNAVLPPASG